MILTATLCTMLQQKILGFKTMESMDNLDISTLFMHLLPGAFLAMTGCTTIDQSGAPRIESVHTNLEQLSNEPENFSGRVVTLSVYVRPLFRGTALERLQLWSKTGDGNCTALNGKAYSISRKDIRNFGAVRFSEHHAFQMEITGKFHSEELIVNPGEIEFSWDGYLTDATLKLKSDSCIVQ